MTDGSMDQKPDQNAAGPVDNAAENKVNNTVSDTAKPMDNNNNGVPAAEVTPEQTNGAQIAAQLAEAQVKLNEYLSSLQRERADFANFRKRIEKERDEIYQNATVETLKKLLPVVDDFDRALTNVPAEKVNDDLIKGFNLIHRKLSGMLEGAGVKAINPKGEAFNPTFHEALGTDDSGDIPSGHVTLVLQKGYVYGDRVLRPALVRVAN